MAHGIVPFFQLFVPQERLIAMDERIPVSSAYFPLLSRQGQRKAKFFKDHRLICPFFEGVEPSYRVSWERLQVEVKTEDARIVQELASCERGADVLVAEYQSIRPRSALGRYVDTTLAVALPMIFSDFQPESGFDLDAFLLVDDEMAPRIVSEIFPRSVKGKMCDAFASVTLDVPCVRIEGEDDSVASNVADLVFSEQMFGGASIEVLENKWLTYTGIWPIYGEGTILRFLNYVAVSILEYGSEGKMPIVKTSINSDLHGKRLDGEIVRTQST
jgi:hypothetical protein